MLEAGQLKGIYVPVVTPFVPDGSRLDEASFRTYVSGLLNKPIQGIVINGTTGESPTVTQEEAETMLRITAELRGNRDIALVLGTGTNNTLTTVQRTERARELGADAVLVVVPYYSRPSQEGLYQHFKKVAEVGVPVIAYDIPGRSGVGMIVETAVRVLELPGVIGLKDCSGGKALVEALAPAGKSVLSGDDAFFLEMMRAGATGGMLASANFHTAEFVAVWEAMAAGRTEEAEARFEALLPFIRLLFKETNPTPIKWLLSRQAVIASDAVRLPLVGITEALQVQLQDEVLEQAQSEERAS